MGCGYSRGSYSYGSSSYSRQPSPGMSAEDIEQAKSFGFGLTMALILCLSLYYYALSNYIKWIAPTTGKQ